MAQVSTKAILLGVTYSSLLPAMQLSNLMTAMGMTPMSIPGVVWLMGLCFFWMIIPTPARSPDVVDRPRPFIDRAIVFILPLLLLISLGRTGEFETIEASARVRIGLQYGLALFLIVQSLRKCELSWIFRALLSALVLYITLNLVLFAVGISRSDEYGVGTTAGTLGLLGINVRRVAFAFSNGLNGFGAIAGLGVLAAMAMGVKGLQGLALKAFAILATTTVLLLTDSRGAMLATFVAAAALYVGRLAGRWMLIGVLLVNVITPFALEAIALFAGPALAATLSRSDADTADVATSRPVIWGAALQKLSEADPELIYGYGIYGQVSSGVSRAYEDVFSGTTGADADNKVGEFASVHNASLQFVMDVGLIGSLLFLLSLLRAGFFFADNLSRRGGSGSPGRFLFAIIIYLGLQGAFEPVPTVYGAESFVVYIAVIAIWYRFSRYQYAPRAQKAESRKKEGGAGRSGTTWTHYAS